MELTKTRYKQTEVGLIPQDWNLERIDDFAKITTGNKDTQDRVEEGLYPFYVRSNTVERINSYSFDGEAILTSGDGVGVGKIFHYLNCKFDYHQRVYNIYNYRENVSGKYLYYQFSTYFYERVMSMTAKSSVDSVRREMIANMLIPLPPTLKEQKAIATALSDVDALIQGLASLIAKKKVIKQGAMQELLTGRRRLAGFGNDKGHKQTEVGVIPVDWEVAEIGNLIEFSGGSQPPRSTFIFHPKEGYIRLLQIRDYKSDKYASYIPLEMAQKFSQVDDIMIGRYGPPIFQILDGLEGAYNVALLKAIPSSKIDREFARHFFKQDVLFKFVEKLSQRSSGQTGVDLYELKRYKFPFSPTLVEQKAIALALSEMDKEIEKLEAKKSKYESIKQGMMQELLTGKTRLL